jgi:hypothetical protein
VLSWFIVVSIRHSLASILEACEIVKQPGSLLCRSGSDHHEADRFRLFGCAKQVGRSLQGSKERAFCTDRRDLVTRNCLVDRRGGFGESHPTPERY